MLSLDPIDLELLYFLCAAKHHRCRVKSIRAPRKASLRRLRDARLVSLDGYEPSASAIMQWLNRRTCAETQTDTKCLTKTPARAPNPAPVEPPTPWAVVRGDGGARKVTPSPKRKRDKRGTSGAHGRGRERAPEGGLANGPIHERKRRTPDTAASTVSTRQREETPRSVGCAEGAAGGAKPIPNEGSPIPKEPAVRSCPPPSARSVDIKVNSPRDPTQKPDTPLMDMKDRQVTRGYQHAAAVRRGQEAEAARLVDAGVNPSTQGSLTANLMRAIIIRRGDEVRVADPIEQAKTRIRCKARLPVFGAEVTMGEEGKGRFFIGNRLVDEAGLLAYAARWAA